LSIKDSGSRTEFDSGAVRDIQKGKGRCDLMPLDVVAQQMNSRGEPNLVMKCIHKFMAEGQVIFLYYAVDFFCDDRNWSMPHMLLEVAKHFEDGAEKYGENNWQKGLPVKSFINSGIRHYLKWLRGDNDEPHDRAFCWNILCAIWTCEHKPDLNDYAVKGGDQ